MSKKSTIQRKFDQLWLQLDKEDFESFDLTWCRIKKIVGDGNPDLKRALALANFAQGKPLELEPNIQVRGPKSDTELRQLAMDYMAGAIVLDINVPAQSLGMVFMCLLFMEDVSDWVQEQNIGVIYEHLSKAGPSSCNGFPIFMSMQWMTKPEFEIFKQHVETLKSFVKPVDEYSHTC